MAKTSLFPTRIDRPNDFREKTLTILDQQLADRLNLFSQINQVHCNVKGPTFHSLHESFDELAEEIEEHVDMLAERATALGGVAMGTARMAAAGSRLPEYTIKSTSGHQHLVALADRYAAHANSTRAAIDTATKLCDAVTADLLTEISRTLDEALWFLESHTQERADRGPQ